MKLMLINKRDNPIEACKPVKRLISSLKYYEMLDIINNKDHQNIFTAFIKDIYKIFLDDYNHLVYEHNDLEDINKAITSKKEFSTCNILKCKYTGRHNSDDEKQIEDGITHFYKTIFDSLHFYLIHLYECGLRIPTSTTNDDNMDNKNDDDNNIYFDNAFSRVTRLINERQHIISSFNRFKSNKFSIGGQQQKPEGKSVFSLLIINTKQIIKQMIQHLWMKCIHLYQKVTLHKLFY